MSGFLYYFPGLKSAPIDEQLEKLGMGHLVGSIFSQAGWDGNETMKGPGVICAIAGSELSEGGTEPKVGYYPQNQEWVQGDEGWWIGWEKENKPVAADLARKEQMPGREVKMGDGNLWLVPCERFLPRTLKLDKNGEIQRTPLPQFAAMGEATAVVWDEYRGVLNARDKNKTDNLMSIKLWIELAIHFLGVNYLTGRVESNELELWNDQSLGTTIEVIVDILGMMEMDEESQGKKKECQDGG